MLKKCLILLSCLAVSAFTYNIMVGSYIKGSFNSNDARIDRSFKVVRDDIFNSNGGSTNVGVIPVAIYHQIVNGINYKIIAAIKDNKNKKVQLVHSIVYSGPFGENYANQTPSITFLEKLPNDLVAIDETKEESIKNAVVESLKNANTNLVKIINIVSHPNLVYDEGFYVVFAETAFGSVASEQYLIVNQNSDKTFTVTNTISFSG